MKSCKIYLFKHIYLFIFYLFFNVCHPKVFNTYMGIKCNSQTQEIS